jgi:hypothetical protein
MADDEQQFRQAEEDRDDELSARVEQILRHDDARALRTLLVEHGLAMGLLFPPLLGRSLRAAMRHGAFACLNLVLDVPYLRVSMAPLLLAHQDVPQSHVASDAWVANVARTIAMVRARLPANWDWGMVCRMALNQHGWATWVATTESVEDTWLAHFLTAETQQRPNPFWFHFFAARASDATLQRLAAAATDMERHVMLTAALEQRRERRQAFAMGGVSRLAPPPPSSVREALAVPEVAEAILRYAH